MVGFPNNHGKTPTKNDQHLGCEMGVPSFKESPIQISRSAVVSFTSYPGSQIPSETSGFKGLSRTSKRFILSKSQVSKLRIYPETLSFNAFVFTLPVFSWVTRWMSEIWMSLAMEACFESVELHMVVRWILLTGQCGGQAGIHCYDTSR